MEPISPTHPISPTVDTAASTSAEQKLIHRETSIVEPPRNTETRREQPQATGTASGSHDEPPAADRGEASGTDAGVVATPGAPAPAISTRIPAVVATSPAPPSASASAPFSPVQLYSPTKTEIEEHPIRQRLSIHGDNVAASGWGSRQEGAIGTDDGGFKDHGEMTEVKEGDKVAWNWGSGAPGGTASEVVTDGDATMVSHRGNEVKKKGSPENPAVHIERPGNDVVKKASELEVEEEGPKHADGEKKDEADEKKDEEEKKDGEGEKKADGETNGDAKTGEKRSAEEANKDDDEGEKADGEEKAAAEPPKKKGRPAKGGVSEKKTPAAKKKEPKKAATADGKPRRSGRNKS